MKFVTIARTYCLTLKASKPYFDITQPNIFVFLETMVTVFSEASKLSLAPLTLNFILVTRYISLTRLDNCFPIIASVFFILKKT